MGKLNFIVLATASLLAALCEGRRITFAIGFCPGGYLDEATISNGILNPINARRENLTNGEQNNGLSGGKMPPATNMTQLSWSCELEQRAATLLGTGCGMPGNTTGPNSGGLANIYVAEYDDGSSPESYLLGYFNSQLELIDQISLPVHTQGTVISYPTYNGNTAMLNYANLVRSANTQIGCALNGCTDSAGNKLRTLYCLLNEPEITNGTALYQGTTTNTGGCSEVNCPTGFACNITTLMCVNTTTTSSSTAPTTMSTAASTTLSTSSSSAPTTSSSTPVATTTTMPTSSQAQFPAGGGTGGRCAPRPNSNRMTDALRDQYVNLHNFRRGLLATGQIPRKDGKYLPKASNMWRISYDCDLEQGAIGWASQCPSALSEPSSRPGIGENLKTFPATRFVFDTAAKKSVTEWWKVIRDVNYFENVVVFRPFHDGAPISSFTQMGWAASNRLGCAIVKCTTDNVFVGVCRYSPRGNIVNSNVYQVGNPCTVNPGATTCNSSDGLWS